MQPLNIGCLPLALALITLVYGEEAFNPLQYVDTLVGSTDGGNVFPGATLPYGVAKAVADTNSTSNQGGFTLDQSPVSGFSVLHDSGTGGSPSLGNFPLFPYAHCPQDDIDLCTFPKKERTNYGTFSNASVVSRPGYFGITLDNGIQAEMTTTHHVALFRFTFPDSPDGNGSYPLLLQDLSDLADTRQNNGTVAVDVGGRIAGGAVFLPSFGSGTYAAYFCTDFFGSAVQDTGIFVNSRASTNVKNLTISRGINGYPLPGGAFVRFESTENPVLARVGVSFISSAQACANAEAEVPDFNFDTVSTAASTAWEEKLSPITVSTGGGVDPSLITNFYSGIYRTMVNPQNYTGENPLWSSSEPYFDSFYCLWDSFRSQIPFLIILDPKAVAQMIRSLIDTYTHEGWLPDCHMTFCKGYTQGGSNADNVLADAFNKGIEDGIDWSKGYEAVVKDAEVEPYDWSNHGRGGLDSWKSLGYIPEQDFDYKGFGTMTRKFDPSRSLFQLEICPGLGRLFQWWSPPTRSADAEFQSSVLMHSREYSYNDFCISQMARGLNKSTDMEKYLQSSENWGNLYDPRQTSSFATGVDTGFTGFFQPRYLNQSWSFQDPLTCSNIDQSGTACSLTNNAQETFESSIWEYGFFVPHNQADLITLYGGPDQFVRRLDFLHDMNITNISNEPSFLTVFQYHYAGRPALSALRSHFYIPRYFNPNPGGLPGNDDSGAMGSFLAFSMMGLFPNPGQDVYLITPPYFESVSIKHPISGKTATIRNLNFDPTYQAVYIQSATLNGEPYTKNWISHSFFTEGKELVLTLGRNESSWGRAVSDLPPSLGDYVGFNGTFSARRLGENAGLKYRGGMWKSSSTPVL
ncbi:glycosyl hydrolase family 92-domain-containing protein [Xylariales sp. AK1849]|nr:glycosyl hydrolase family 92-domain-containing protein [Xylariales sp. AK1849]